MSKTILTDRVLYSDGDSVFKSEDISNIISSGTGTTHVFVDYVTEEIAQFNTLVSKNEQIDVKQNTSPNDLSWKIPSNFEDIDIPQYINDKKRDILIMDNILDNEAEVKKREQRIELEFELFNKLQLIPILRVLIYIINTLREKNIVWGVGRGSSVSSYLLYVIGVHDVDSVKYQLDIHEFLRV